MRSTIHHDTILLRGELMLFPNSNSADWAIKYDLEIQATTCLCCKQEVLMNVPVAIKNYRGFKTEDHGCPKKYDQYFLAPINHEEQLKLQSAIY